MTADAKIFLVKLNGETEQQDIDDLKAFLCPDEKMVELTPSEIELLKISVKTQQASEIKWSKNVGKTIKPFQILLKKIEVMK